MEASCRYDYPPLYNTIEGRETERLYYSCVFADHVQDSEDEEEEEEVVAANAQSLMQASGAIDAVRMGSIGCSEQEQWKR